MIQLFKYNWQVRDEWFAICETLSAEDLLIKRTGGPGSILYTLFHIVEVEYSWINAMQGKPDIPFQFDDYQSVEKVKKLSNSLRETIECYLSEWTEEDEQEYITASWLNESFSKGEILRHIIAHEIYHIGQLSIWGREVGIKPASASFIGRNLIIGK
jgi:uncharacterized damage-inducible protein DinB